MMVPMKVLGLHLVTALLALVLPVGAPHRRHTPPPTAPNAHCLRIGVQNAASDTTVTLWSDVPSGGSDLTFWINCGTWAKCDALYGGHDQGHFTNQTALAETGNNLRFVLQNTCPDITLTFPANTTLLQFTLSESLGHQPFTAAPDTTEHLQISQFSQRGNHGLRIFVKPRASSSFFSTVPGADPGFTLSPNSTVNVTTTNLVIHSYQQEPFGYFAKLTAPEPVVDVQWEYNVSYRNYRAVNFLQASATTNQVPSMDGLPTLLAWPLWSIPQNQTVLTVTVTNPADSGTTLYSEFGGFLFSFFTATGGLTCNSTAGRDGISSPIGNGQQFNGLPVEIVGPNASHWSLDLEFDLQTVSRKSSSNSGNVLLRPGESVSVQYGNNFQGISVECVPLYTDRTYVQVQTRELHRFTDSVLAQVPLAKKMIHDKQLG